MRWIIYIILLSCFPAIGQDVFYVKPSGSDSNSGADTTNAWATWQYAFDHATPADTVYFLGGVYMSTSKNIISPVDELRGYSGKEDSIITYAGYPPHVLAGNMPILDCIYHCDSSENTYNKAIEIENCEYLHFKDLEVRNVLQCGTVIAGAIESTRSRNLTFEHIILHNVGQRGYYIRGGAWKSYYDDGWTEVVPYWDDMYDTTRFINCDTYMLCDSFSAAGVGNGADGWKTTHYKGNHVIWEGCRAWFYTDDMIDPSLGNGATFAANNCWAMPGTGYDSITVGGSTYGQEQNGIKASKVRSNDPFPLSYHGGVITNCLAMFGRGTGFPIIDQNTASYWQRGNFAFYNNTSYWFRWCFTSTGSVEADWPRYEIWRNNLAYVSTSTGATGDPSLVSINSNDTPEVTYPESNNTWIWKDGYPDFDYSPSVTVTDADFINIDSASLVAEFTAPRQSDGSLPIIKPLRLAEGSDLINAGTTIPAIDSVDYTLLFNGTAPDIGAFESNYEARTEKPLTGTGNKVMISNGVILHNNE